MHIFVYIYMCVFYFNLFISFIFIFCSFDLFFNCFFDPHCYILDWNLLLLLLLFI
ncbi:expressed protein [Phakopsora pachyrhizi]|uniref:Expressed protein n=1 Tax=Phakopsora pachyrhizi TaxID=170000 RepID=A0AAV0AIL4_PHAPC|nr:expressed protein [Phakopsora pachyrhizi]